MDTRQTVRHFSDPGKVFARVSRVNRTFLRNGSPQTGGQGLEKLPTFGRRAKRKVFYDCITGPADITGCGYVPGQSPAWKCRNGLCASCRMYRLALERR